MRIRALVHIAGANFHLGPGDETDRFPADEAMRLVKKNAAVLVDAGAPVETTDAVDTALETRKRGRKR